MSSHHPWPTSSPQQSQSQPVIRSMNDSTVGHDQQVAHQTPPAQPQFQHVLHQKPQPPEQQQQKHSSSHNLQNAASVSPTSGLTATKAVDPRTRGPLETPQKLAGSNDHSAAKLVTDIPSPKRDSSTLSGAVPSTASTMEPNSSLMEIMSSPSKTEKALIKAGRSKAALAVKEPTSWSFQRPTASSVHRRMAKEVERYEHPIAKQSVARVYALRRAHSVDGLQRDPSELWRRARTSDTIRGATMTKRGSGADEMPRVACDAPSPGNRVGQVPLTPRHHASGCFQIAPGRPGAVSEQSPPMSARLRKQLYMSTAIFGGTSKFSTMPEQNSPEWESWVSSMLAEVLQGKQSLQPEATNVPEVLGLSGVLATPRQRRRESSLNRNKEEDESTKLFGCKDKLAYLRTNVDNPLFKPVTRAHKDWSSEVKMPSSAADMKATIFAGNDVVFPKSPVGSTDDCDSDKPFNIWSPASKVIRRGEDDDSLRIVHAAVADDWGQRSLVANPWSPRPKIRMSSTDSTEIRAANWNPLGTDSRLDPTLKHQVDTSNSQARRQRNLVASCWGHGKDEIVETAAPLPPNRTASPSDLIISPRKLKEKNFSDLFGLQLPEASKVMRRYTAADSQTMDMMDTRSEVKRMSSDGVQASGRYKPYDFGSSTIRVDTDFDLSPRQRYRCSFLSSDLRAGLGQEVKPWEDGRPAPLVPWEPTMVERRGPSASRKNLVGSPRASGQTPKTPRGLQTLFDAPGEQSSNPARSQYIEQVLVSRQL